MIIAEALHTDKFSIIDDADKIQVIVNNGICPETGDRMYDMHERQDLYSSDAELPDEFNGRNRINPNNPSPLHPSWPAVLKVTTTAKIPNIIQGSTRFLRRYR